MAALVAQDLPREAIAAALQVTVDHLESAFPTELAHGAAITKAKITASLLAGVDGDSVAAARKLDEMLAGSGPKTPPPKIGKKETARRAANEAVQGGGKFTPRPAPPAADDLGELVRERAGQELNGSTHVSRNKLQ